MILLRLLSNIFCLQHILEDYSRVNNIFPLSIADFFCCIIVVRGDLAMTDDFVRNRITQLRLQKGVSEYQMSYDLGHSRGYIYNISSGKSLPPLSELFAICDYFGITPAEFFDDSISNPELIRKAVEGMKQLDDGDQLMILNHINRLLKK